MSEKQELKPILEESGKSKNIVDPTLSVSSQNESDSPEERPSCADRTKYIMVTLFTVFCIVGYQISLPMCAAGLYRVNSDVYPMFLQPFWNVVLVSAIVAFVNITKIDNINVRPTMQHLKIALIVGILNTTSNCLQNYSSLPARTPGYLQVIMSTFIVPSSVLIRYFMTKEGIGWKRGVCVLVTLLGVAVSMVPQVLPAQESNESLVGNRTETSWERINRPLVGRILFPIVFAIGFIPTAAMMVYAERDMDENDTHPLALVMHFQCVSLLAGMAIFWTDLIPGFGMANSWEQFSTHLWRGIKCTYTTSDGCDNLVTRWWVNTLALALQQTMLICQVFYTHGAIYTVLLMTASLPIGTLFWTLYSDENFLKWDPRFTVQSICGIVALLIVMPAVIAYDVMSVRKERKRKGEPPFEELK